MMAVSPSVESATELIESTHAYLLQQHDAATPQRFQLVQSSQARTLKLQLESWPGGLSKDAAATHLDAIRAGPWAPIHIHGLSEALDTAVRKFDKTSVAAPDRKVQICNSIEHFWTDNLWTNSHDTTTDRKRRLETIAVFLCTMDLTNPDPACKQRICAMVGLGDPWVRASATNAKVCLDDLGTALKKIRPPARLVTRPHIVLFPRDPAAACEVIDGFLERVYPDEGPSESPPFSTADIDALMRDTVLRWSNKNVRGDAPGAGAHAPMSLNLDSPNPGHTSQPQSPMHQMQQMQQMAMMAMMPMMQMMQGGFMPGMSGMGGMGGGGMPNMGGVGGGGMMGGATNMMGIMGGGAGGGGGGGYHPGARGMLCQGINAHGGRGRNPLPIQDGAAGVLQNVAANRDEPAAEGDAEGQVDVNDGSLESLEQALGNAAGKAYASPKGNPKGNERAKPTAKPPTKGSPGLARKADARVPNVRKVVAKKPAACKSLAGVPYWEPEDSRSQLMCRTRKGGPWSSHAIKYEVAGGKAAAVKLANAWVEKKKRAKA